MHGGDVAGGAFERDPQPRIECVECVRPALARHRDGREGYTVELAGQCTQGIIATDAHTLNNCRSVLAHDALAQRRAIDDRTPGECVERIEGTACTQHEWCGDCG